MPIFVLNFMIIRLREHGFQSTSNMPKIENNETLYSGPGKLCYDQLLPNLTQHSSLATLAPSAIFLPEDNAALLGLRPRHATDREVGLRGACQRPDM